MLFNEPKLLKSFFFWIRYVLTYRFSALQRAEIAEIKRRTYNAILRLSVSVLFNEPKLLKFVDYVAYASIVQRFSALQRAEIAEISTCRTGTDETQRFSALQRAEIAEIIAVLVHRAVDPRFQCSSTSRNC